MTTIAPLGHEPATIEPLSACVTRVPLRSHTLPPATRTNTYVVQGRAHRWVIDLGAHDESELERLGAYLDETGAPAGLLLTHHHADHVAGVAWFRERYGVPVWATAETWEALGVEVSATSRVLDGTSEPEADGVGAIPTPGHARGHVSFALPDRHVCVGDLVAGIGTIIVDPPDGNMSQYMSSLYAIASRWPAGIHPAHGPSPADPEDYLAAYIAHRVEREQKVAGALAPEAQTLEQVTARAYDDVPTALHGFAARSALAHLEKLEREGAATLVDAGWLAV